MSDKESMTLKEMMEKIWNTPGVANPFGPSKWQFVKDYIYPQNKLWLYKNRKSKRRVKR